MSNLMEHDPVFIVGCGRSGTTLLRVMLASSDRLMIPPESDFLWRAARRFGPGARMTGRHEEFVSMLEAISSFPALELSSDEIRHELAGQPSETVAHCVSAVYRLYARKSGRSRWGDKNPFYVRYLGLIQRLFPNLRVIHVVRDGRDVAVSVRKTKMRPHNLFLSARRWASCVEAGRRWGAQHQDRYLEIRYEALVAHPEQELKRVCDFIGEPFSPAMLEYHKDNQDLRHVAPAERGHHGNLARPIMRRNTDKWRAELTLHDQQIIEAVAGRTLSASGYSRVHDAVPLWLKAYVQSCELRYGLGARPLVRRLVDAAPWRVRWATRKALLIDNEHYR
jgi:hypothetical protein